MSRHEIDALRDQFEVIRTAKNITELERAASLNMLAGRITDIEKSFPKLANMIDVDTLKDWLLDVSARVREAIMDRTELTVEQAGDICGDISTILAPPV